MSKQPGPEFDTLRLVVCEFQAAGMSAGDTSAYRLLDAIENLLHPDYQGSPKYIQLALEDYIRIIPIGEPEEEYESEVRALAKHLEVEPYEIGETLSSFGYGNQEWLVLTDIEADGAWDESLNSYLDEVIIPEMPSHVAQYFDRDSWIADARHDGRGQSLSGYDGGEYDVEIDGETFYLFRTN